MTFVSNASRNKHDTWEISLIYYSVSQVLKQLLLLRTVLFENYDKQSAELHESGGFTWQGR